MMSHQSAKKDLLNLLVLMAIATAIGVYLLVTCVVIHRDGIFYIEQAQGLTDNPLAVARKYPVGYPVLLFLAHKLMGMGDSAQAWVYSSQVFTLLTRILALIPLYFIGKRLVGPQRSVLAVLILIFLPHLAGYGSSVLREWPFVLFLSLGFWLLIVALTDKRWWMFGFIGLVAGLGYLIRPMTAQIVVYGLVGLAVAYRSGDLGGSSKILAAAVLMIAGMAVPVLPFLIWTGRILPPQLNQEMINRPPTIVSVGGQSASLDPLEFEVPAGRELELKVQADDPDGDDLTVSIVGTPLGTRPVHRLRSAADDTCFWTISETDKNTLLKTYGSDTWHYEGIAYYAHPTAESALGLKPVYRFWSAVANRHFYTIADRPQDALPDDPNSWQPEGVAFYAFPQGAQPADSIPVYRIQVGSGRYSWTTEAPATGGDVAWYAAAAIVLPEGTTVQDKTFRWRTVPGQQQGGPYQLNVIVGDGELLSCQIVRIHVGPAMPMSPADDGLSGEATSLPRQSIHKAGLEKLPGIVIEVIASLSHTLRVFFLMPLCLGFYHRFKHPASRYERALMLAVVAVNIGLIMFRGLWVDPDVARRYCIPLIVLTIYCIPIGLEIMADGLKCTFRQTQHWPWVWILAAVGIAICIPRLIEPIGASNRGYLQVAQWLQSNTEPDEIIAVPDNRVGFYADREAVIYNRRPDPRTVRYVVIVRTAGQASDMPSQWHERFSFPIGRKQDRELVVCEIQ